VWQREPASPCPVAAGKALCGAVDGRAAGRGACVAETGTPVAAWLCRELSAPQAATHTTASTQAIASFFNSNDDLVGTAVDDDIVGSYYPGYNWFVKGDNNITNGWINLLMR